MSNRVLEMAYAAKGQTYLAPSGILYTLRLLTQGATIAALKAIPTLMNGDGPPKTTSADQIEQNSRFQAEIVRGCIVSISFGDEMTTEIPPVDDLPATDVARIFTWAQTGTGLVGPEAEAARGVL